MQRDARRALGELEEEEEEEEVLDADADIDMGGAGQLSPVSEEKEVEELVDAYYGHEEVFDDDAFGDDPDYEEAFMEVLSQEMGGVLGSHLGSVARDSSGVELTHVVGSGGRPQDGDMDMT